MEEIDSPVHLNSEEFKMYEFKDPQLTHPWVYSNDFKLRKFTYEKYYQHNDLQVGQTHY